MLAMNIPGFTAEASLCEATRGFRSRGVSWLPGQKIYPAQVRPWPVDVVGFGELDTEPSRTYGTITPGNEDKFNACVTNCLAGPWRPTHAACWRTCCRQITGFQSCLIA
jgi:hypothetical protein